MAITINGKEYDETKFSDKLKNYIIARQEIQSNKTRLLIEIEKIDVLTEYYNNRIIEELGIDVKETKETKQMAAVANLSIDQGATFTSDITVKDINGNVFDLTGYTAVAKLARGYSSTRTRTAMATSFAQDRTTGILSISLTANQTASLDPERYVYDVEITSSGGIVTRVLEGIITVRPEVSTS